MSSFKGHSLTVIIISKFIPITWQFFSGAVVRYYDYLPYIASAF